MTLPGRVLRAQSGHFRVLTERGVLACRIRGRLKKGKAVTDLAVIGDRVEVSESAPGEGLIERVLPRDNRFARQQPGSRGRFKEDVLVANLDWLLVVLACSEPPPNQRLLDRFLVIAEHDHIRAAIVANKIDQVDPAEAEALFAPYEALGYPVHYVSALRGDGLDGVRERITGRLCAVVGPSGVGKSSVLNALEPGLALTVGEIIGQLSKGRHTTRVAELHPFGEGGWIADTPGIRELASFQLPPESLAECFPEMRPHLGGCRFRDCLHREEPRCAVRAAVAAGEIAESRYDSYRRQLEGQER